MPLAQTDIKAKLTTYPYLNPSVALISTASTGQSGESPEASTALDQLIAVLLGFEIPSIIPPTEQPVTGEDQWLSGSFSENAALQALVKNLGVAVEGINKIVEVLTKVLQIIELFVSTFSSFSKIIVALIEYGKQTVLDFTKDLKGGVYVNVLAPPAFLTGSSDDPNYVEQSRGGFEGFLTRLQASINNPADVNRPDYSSTAEVGGMVVLLDAESVDLVWSGLRQMAGMFDFMKVFGMELSPPPPKNLRGKCKYDTVDVPSVLSALGEVNTTTKKLVIKLEWDASPLVSNYVVYRGIQSGGVTKEIEYMPSSLMDDQDTHEPGIFTFAKDSIMALLTKKPGPKKPTKFIQVYEDPTFNNGQPVKVKDNTFFIDEFVDENVMEYFYIVKSDPNAGEAFYSKSSMELSVLVKKCNNLVDMADVIPHPAGHYEFLSMGYARMNSWTSIQVNLLMPWMEELSKILVDFLDSMKGMANDASDSFTAFLKQITDKIQLYMGILNTVSFILDALKNFIIGPSISFLELPPAKGGTANFVERIRTAQLPAGHHPFSGANGVSIGIVVMYGGLGSEQIGKGISAIISLITKK